MPILQVLQGVVRELGLPDITTVVGSTDRTTTQLLAIANRVGEDLKTRAQWPQLSKEYTFTLVDGQEGYALPSDIDQVIFRTNWDRTNHWELEGPLSPQEWQYRKSGVSQVSPRRKFRVRGASNNSFLIFPTPGPSDAGAIMVFEYQSTNWIAPKTWITATVFAAATYCFFNGNIYYTTLGGTTGATAPTHTTGSVSDGGVTWTYFDGVYSSFLADTDTCLISEMLVGLGVQWRFMRQKGLDYEEIRADFEQALVSEVFKIEGAPTLRMSPGNDNFLIGWWSIPDTGYGS